MLSEQSLSRGLVIAKRYLRGGLDGEGYCQKEGGKRQQTRDGHTPTARSRQSVRRARAEGAKVHGSLSSSYYVRRVGTNRGRADGPR